MSDPTADTSDATAAGQVSNTTELLESILANTSTYDIAVSRQVNQRWRSVIKGSAILQRLLFLKPEDSGLSVVWQKKADGTYDPFGDAELQYRPFIGADLTSLDGFWLQKVVRIHPLLDYRIEEGPGKPTQFQLPVRKMMRFRDGEWLDMLIAQPPVTALSIHFRISSDDGPFDHKLPVVMAAGIKFRHLVEAIRTGLHMYNQHHSNEWQHHDGDGCEEDPGELEEHNADLEDITALRWQDADAILKDDKVCMDDDTWVAIKGVMSESSPYVAMAYERLLQS